MKIDRKLHLVFPIKRDDGSELYVHATPIGANVIEQFWDLMGQTMNEAMSRYGIYAPRYCARMLKKVAAENAGSDKSKQAQQSELVERGFLAEIRRMSNVFVLGEGGWEMMPLDEARKSGLITERQADEIETASVFFICALDAHLDSQMGEIMGGLGTWGAQTSLLGCTEFKNYLRTSTKAESTGETATA